MILMKRLNPCCNGRGSKTAGLRPRGCGVLILVVMEEGQRHQWFSDIVGVSVSVLILVVMEEGQRHPPNKQKYRNIKS